MLQTRLNKLMYQKKMLGELDHSNPINTNTNFNYDSMYKLRTMNNARGKLSNPSMYNNNHLKSKIIEVLNMGEIGGIFYFWQ